MAIPQTRYVKITSGVGAVAAATNRELIARLFTSNALAPMGSVLEFTSLAAVGEYFGTTSNEYLFSAKYFGWVSKDIRVANKISFARYSLSELVPQIIATQQAGSIASFTAITDGSFVITMGNTSTTIDGLNFSEATDLASVQTIIQEKMATITGTSFEGSTIVFSNGRFTFNGGDQTYGLEITYATNAASGTPIAPLLGWSQGTNPVISNGSTATTMTAELDRISDLSNNFGSFYFLDQLSPSQLTEVAAWNAAQDTMYMFVCTCTKETYTEVHQAVQGYKGTWIQDDEFNAFAAYMPMVIGATIDYSRADATVNFMFHQFTTEQPSVTTEQWADIFDPLGINYYGATQQAGKQIAFLQRGLLQGSITDAGVYYNEMWLKDEIITQCFNMFIALRKVPANSDGIARASGIISSSLEIAKFNGTIIPDKELTDTQIAYITQISNDPDAWHSVQTNGLWFDMNIKSQTVGDVVEYYLDYILIYSKGDSIRKVEGSDILI